MPEIERVTNLPQEREPDLQAKTRDGNPTPLDVLFILSTSVMLLLLLVWIATTLLGRPLPIEPPQWIKDAVSTLWKKAILGSGVAGSAAASLALRKWLYNNRPGPKYLIWIPFFTGILIVALLVVELVVRQSQTPLQASLVQVPVRFGVQPPPTNATDNSPRLPLIRVAIRSPQTKEMTDALLPTSDPDYPYKTVVDVPLSPELNFLAELNPIVGSRYDPNFTGHLYEICLKANAKRPFPTPGSPEASTMLVKLKCLATGKCPRANDDPSYAVACEEPVGRSFGLVPLAYAAEGNQQALQPGWIVPSLDSLSKMPEPTRIGYTRFDVTFSPEGLGRKANRYYYSLKVNEQPIYIDGFLPDRMIFPLQSGQNQISFALENLNFTGQFAGFEKLHLAIVFLDTDKVVYRQELEREYAALRDATSIPPIQTDVGTFQWTGKYIVPKRENRYEILLASASCGNPPRRDCVDHAVYTKNQFDKYGLTFEDKPVVMVVRPPLRVPAAYGLALGLVQPTTQQVQFTFDADEAAQLCQWASRQVGKGNAGKFIRPDLNRYEVATRAYQHCQ